jgi:HlyD family secretion protein
MKINLKKISKKWWIIGGVVLLLLIVVVFVRSRSTASTSTATLQTVKAEVGTLSQTIGATGTVEASQSADLVCGTSGNIASVNAKIGDTVSPNQVLAELDPASVPQSVVLAASDLVSAQLALEQAKQSDLGRAQAEQAVVTDQQAVDDAQKKFDSLNYPRASDAVIQNTEAQIQLAQRQLAKASDSYHSVVRMQDKNPQKAQALLDMTNAQIKLNNLIANYNWYTGQPSSLDYANAKAALDIAKAQLLIDQQTLDKYQNGPNPDDVAAAQAKVDAAQNTLNQAKIIAPFSGTVTAADAQVGDMISSGTMAFRVDNMAHLWIEVQVSEVDINNVKVGQPATIEFDAIQGKTYDGKVTKVNLAGDVSTNAVNFTVTVELTSADAQVKPGMTAVVTIIVKQKENALIVPNTAIHTLNNNSVVYVESATGGVHPVQIQTGLVTDTATEVIGETIKAGDTLVLNPTSISSNSNRSGFSLFRIFGGGGGAAGGGGFRGGAGGGGFRPGGG